MEYNQFYFTDIKRYAPFSLLDPLTSRNNFFRERVLGLISLKESIYSKIRLKKIIDLKAESFLDFGCGSGELVKLALYRNIEAYGADISKYQIEQLNKLAPGKFKLSDGLSLPFKDKRFDVVTAFHVLEHIDIDNLPAVIKELSRVCRGHLIIELPTSENFHAKVDPSHISILSNKEWSRIFNSTLGRKWKTVRFRNANKLLPLQAIFSLRG